MNYNIIGAYIIGVALFMGFVIVAKDKRVGAKYIFAFKASLTFIIPIVVMYIYKGKIAILIGLTTGVISLTMFDKDYSDRLVVEGIKTIIIQLLVGVAAYYAGYNYISLIVISLILIFVIYILFTHNGKVSRVKGFLMTYVILIYMNVPKVGNNYSEIFQALFVGSILAIILYYFFNRNTYFKKNNIINWEFFKTNFKIRHIIFDDADRDREFRNNTIIHGIISTIAMTAAIFYMKYYGSVESVWIIISVGAMLLPDVELSRKFVIDRIIGTIVGAMIFLILHQLPINIYIIYIFLAIAIYFSVFPMGYHNNAVFITYFTLEVHLLLTKLTPIYLVKYRIGFTVVGALIVIGIFAIDSGIKLNYLLKKNNVDGFKKLKQV
ncbi:FUSC family protein [Cetobacterium sp.]|uniref:FUSC family protein n=1 Tax=Cetobacterium sp. TaxID=2071632 RepID=UPI003F40FC13